MSDTHTTLKPQYPVIDYREHDPLQDYFIDGNSWYSVAKLVDDTKNLEPFEMPMAGMNLSDVIWGGCTIADLGYHCKRVVDADLSKPIILSWDGSIADGRHRIIKALIEGRNTILAVRMTWKPKPCKEVTN